VIRYEKGGNKEVVRLKKGTKEGGGNAYRLGIKKKNSMREVPRRGKNHERNVT